VLIDVRCITNIDGGITIDEGLFFHGDPLTVVAERAHVLCTMGFEYINDEDAPVVEPVVEPVKAG
jgi:hypothetical protein